MAAPRSGSTFLFESLAQARDVCTIGGESHALFEGLPRLRPGVGGLTSNRLTADHLTPQVRDRLYARFRSSLQDRDGAAVSSGKRLLEKTPKNALRVPFLRALFPGARFIYLVRSPAANISAIMEAWRSGRFVTYRHLPDWDGPWSLALPPGWEAQRGRSLAEVAAWQWRVINETAMRDLAALPGDRWVGIDYDSLCQRPGEEIRRLAARLDLHVDQRHAAYLQQDTLPLSRYTLTPPAPEKWQKNAAELERLLPSVAPLWQQLQQFIDAEVATS